MPVVLDFFFICFLVICVSCIPILLFLLDHQKHKIRILEKKIKLYEEEIFISNKALMYDDDFLQALSSLNEEFPD